MIEVVQDWRQVDGWHHWDNFEVRDVVMEQLAGIGQEIDISRGRYETRNPHRWVVVWDRTECHGQPDEFGEGKAGHLIPIRLQERLDLIEEGPWCHTVIMGKDEPGILGWDEYCMASTK